MTSVTRNDQNHLSGIESSTMAFNFPAGSCCFLQVEASRLRSLTNLTHRLRHICTVSLDGCNTPHVRGFDGLISSLR